MAAAQKAASADSFPQFMTSGNHTQNLRPLTFSRAAAVEVHYTADGNLSSGSLTDLGPGKLQLVGERDFPAGTELELRFGHNPARSSGVITMKACVQHSQPGKMAIAFVSVRPSEQAKTLSTIRQLAGTSRK